MRKILSKKRLWIFTTFILILAAIIIFNKVKSLPEGISYESDILYTDEVTFLNDLTYEKFDGNMTAEQEIFKHALKMIQEAKEFIVVDMFLFNDYTSENRDFPDLSGELAEMLIKQKEKYPDLQIVFITDPINTGYYSYKEKHLEELRDHNIEVVVTSLSELRDSNTVYSAVWRLLFQVFGQKGTGWLPNPFADDAPKFTLRSYLDLFNVKANHRKVIATEENALVASANPHNESGFASNIAFKVSGDIIRDIVEAEQAVINYSGGKTIINQEQIAADFKGDIEVQYVTEGKVLRRILQEIEDTESGDELWLGMFYIADREVINELHDAANRGVKVRMILDPNKAAFGNQKAGLPNVPVAHEMIKDKEISIKWYNAKEDQYHTKLLYIKKEDKGTLIGGSANYTTRNLDDLNLESDLIISASLDKQVMIDADDYFNKLWNNQNGKYTLEYEENEGTLTPVLRLTYWVQKLTGLTTY